MHHDPFAQLGQLMLMAIPGAFAGLARVLCLYDITLDKLRILSNVIGGAVVAIMSGGLFVFFYPDQAPNMLVIAAISSAAGALGFPLIASFITQYVKGYVDAKVTVIPQQVEEETRKQSHPRVADEDEFSSTTQRLIDSNEFNAEDIAQMVEEARARRQKIKEQLGIQDESGN